MGDNHHCRAARFRQLNGGTQRLLAFWIEIGIRFIQQDQLAIAKERTGKTDTLALPPGELVTVAPYLGLVAGWQRQDHLMRLREHGRGDDVLVPRVFVKAGDGFGHGAAKKLHVLRKIADKLPELVRVPVLQGCVVQPDRAAARSFQPRHQAQQGRFSGASRADNDNNPGRLAFKRDACED